MSKLWDLVSNRQCIEPLELKEAIKEQLATDDLDWRTCLLIQESADLLRDKFGMYSDRGPRVEAEKAGFPNLAWKVGAMTKPETIHQFLRTLGRQLNQSAEIIVGGSSALILQGLLARHTQDVDVVDEVPPQLRHLRLVGEELYIAHFQSHYLPEGWRDRLHSLGDFGLLRVFLVDGKDIFLGKFFSQRDKDRQDLRYLQQHFDPEAMRRHLLLYGQKLASDPKLSQAAGDNWYVIWGEELPG